MTEQLLQQLRQAIHDKRRRLVQAEATGDPKRKQIKTELLHLMEQLYAVEAERGKTG